MKILLFSIFLLSSTAVFSQNTQFKIKTDTLGAGTYQVREAKVNLNHAECIGIWQSYTKKSNATTGQLPGRTFVYETSSISLEGIADLVFSCLYKCAPVSDSFSIVSIYADENTGNNPAFTLFVSGYAQALDNAIEKGRVVSIKEEIKDLEQEKKEQEKEVKKLNTAIDKRENEIRKDEGKIDENKSKIDNMTNEIAKNTGEINTLNSEIGSFDVKGKEDHLKTLNKDASKLLNANKKLNSKIDKNVKSIAKMEQEKAANEVAIEQIRAQALETVKIDALQSEARKMEKKADKIEKENKKLDDKVADLNIKNADNQKLIDANIGTAEAKKAQALEIKKQIDKFDLKGKNKRIKSLGKSNKKLSKSKEKLASKNTDITTDIDETKSDKESLEGTVNEKKEAVEEKKQDIKEKKQKVKK